MYITYILIIILSFTFKSLIKKNKTDEAKT